MLVVNLFSGPGGGKSTSAANAFAYLKNHGIRAELVGEEAKDMLYQGRAHELGPDGNQLLLFSHQYARLLNLARADCEVAISDSPLFQNIMYAPSYWAFPELQILAGKVEREWPTVNVFIKRTKKYDPFGRTQKTIDEAQVIDQRVLQSFNGTGKNFDLTVTGDKEGQKQLKKWLLDRIRPAALDIAWNPDTIQEAVCLSSTSPA